MWWNRLWLTCLLTGGMALLGGGAMRAVALFSVFRPFTVEIEPSLTPVERLQSYRIVASGSPYVWVGGMLFFVGVGGSVVRRWRQVRRQGWVLMAAVLAVLALLVELWILLRFDIPLVRSFSVATPTVELVERLILERVHMGGAVATLAALAEWTIVLLFIWRPLERDQHES
ncbi:MAG: hypothetical protein NZ473_04440 [Candidatus Kapabacteria bacterium]|nr:hypothetical protein [Candidatus Kapabacteria bacterium]MCS7169557.1 hypothetical protein [Candidatus Kapabacteria bacterium]MDW7997758.1 hypothetical protein [Bacteroidota bacterium]MDW8225604.1 hypothetical protein [Bacteroidota bacterium]